MPVDFFSPKSVQFFAPRALEIIRDSPYYPLLSPMNKCFYKSNLD